MDCVRFNLTISTPSLIIIHISLFWLFQMFVHCQRTNLFFTPILSSHLFYYTPLHWVTWHGLNGHLKKQSFLPPFSSCHITGVKWVTKWVWSVASHCQKVKESFLHLSTTFVCWIYYIAMYLSNFERSSGNQYIGYWWEAFETWFPKICAFRRGLSAWNLCSSWILWIVKPLV